MSGVPKRSSLTCTFIVLLVLLFPRGGFCEEEISRQAVTYTFSGGRFGDNLLAYMHAKWVSYKYCIPLVYRHFPYAEHLKMPYQEIFHPNTNLNSVEVRCEEAVQQAMEGNSLIVIPYFPESLYERQNYRDIFRNFFAYIPVDWDDEGFRQELKKQIAPVVPVEAVQIPDGVVSVACHLRRGGGVDDEGTFRVLGLKFPQNNFFISEIDWLLKVFPNDTLFVYLFTDDQNPILIKQQYEQIFRGKSIVFTCRYTQNHHALHVLDDFFNMARFDCFIHGESNFAVCSGKISDCVIESYPTEAHWEGNNLIIDKVKRKVRLKNLLKKFATADFEFVQKEAQFQ